MDLKAEIKWIESALLESKDPTFVEAVKNMILSMRKVRETALQEQSRQDALMEEAEADIRAGKVYSTEEAHKIVVWTKRALKKAPLDPWINPSAI